MKKIFISIFIIAISFSFVNAESKNSKSDDEFMKEFMQLDKKVKEEENKQARLEERQKEAKLKTIKSQRELESTQKLGKSLDELGKVIEVDKK